MESQLDQLNQQLSQLKVRVFDAEEALQQTRNTLETLVSTIADVSGFEVENSQVNLEHLVEHIKALALEKEQEQESETIEVEATED